MWSVGVLIYVLLSGCSPFGGDTKQETFCNIAQCRLDFPDDLFEEISEEAKDLMRKLMVKNPSKRLTARETLEHHWFNMAHELKSPVHSVSHSSFGTTPRTPTLSKRPAPTLEHSEERALSIEVTDEPSEIATDNHINESLSTEKLLDNMDNEINKEERKCNENIAIPEERRKSFHKTMKELVERLENETEDLNSNKNTTNNNRINDTCSNDVINHNSDIVNETEQLKNNAVNESTEQYDSDIPSTSKLMRVGSYRSVNRAIGMQTMPVSRIVQCKFDEPCNLFMTSSGRPQPNFIFHQEHTTDHRDNYRCESIFKFRRVFILDDSDDNLSPPPSINGSLSSDNSSMSDSNSDSISEMSIDSSSDRSSVISLDDSLDFMYSKTGSHYSSCYNVWESVKSQSSMAGGRGCPRECSGSIARALSKFTTSSHDISDFKENGFHQQRKSLTIFNNSAFTSRVTTKTLTTVPAVNKKCVGLELTREKNSNVVVIREVKAVHGSKFPRCSEVKCESVQARIRRLQIQNGLQTELAKRRFDMF